ncbi:MAG: hypothetical protein AAGH65_03565 [Pseudomonadota bacterium]
MAADEIEHPFQFSLGGFWNEVDATVASTPNGFDKVELDLDRLGLDDRATIFWSEGTWRFTERWSANLSYSQFSSDGLAEATADGVYEDIEWEAGAALATDFGIGLAIANITWDFVSTDRTRAGIGLGVHTANLEFDITASARIETSEGVFEEVVETTGNDLLAPLPNVALTASHEFTDNLRLLGYLGYFSLSYDDYDGTLVSTRVALEWFPWENVGFGGALQYVDVELEIEQSRRVDDYEVALFGPIAYATFRF